MKKKVISMFLTAAVLACCFASFTACAQKQESAEPAEETVEAVEEEIEAVEEDVEAVVEEAEAAAEEADALADGDGEAAAVEEDADAAVTGEESTEMANPWTEFDSAEEAAENAGIEALSVQEMEIFLGTVTPYSYRSTENLVETVVEFPAVEMRIRKGTGFEDGDCSGDYNVYANAWTQNVKGLEVQCFGNDEGRSSKTIWTIGDYSYSVSVLGLGGDENFGLDADAINSLVNGIQ